jgi:hypothetical protein
MQQDNADLVEQDVNSLVRPGGWFAIRALQKLLTPEADAHFQRALKPLSSDLQPEPPRVIALRLLPQIVPNSPFTPSAYLTPGARIEKVIDTWNDWISAHHAELSKLEPTGEGVDFSDKACPNRPPAKKR